MVNNVVLVGRLVRDVDLRQTSTGKMMTYFTLAVNRNFKNEQGEQAADFIGCVAFDKKAENMARFLSKGSLISVEGRISTRNFQGNDGKTVYVTEVVASNITFLESKKQQGNTTQYGQVQNSSYSQQANNGFGEFEDNIDFNMGWNPFQED
ncbi:single-stranded DNA-binding protein [Gemella haemolysans]|uniref:single-stranded DNA-binding protein n=1 Tax=Gemella haemolysans TaxID=1379 RepID=UPI00232EE4EE|nr:single-stranded DNA-binding protein [Gemella haemolysans]MDB6212539.1 single-stranded DNA-binding protein [Gemella haemolysans]